MLECLVPRANPSTATISIVDRRSYAAWAKRKSAFVRNWLEHNGFSPERGKLVVCPGKDGHIAEVVLGVGDPPSLWDFAVAAARVPAGRYAFDEAQLGAHADDAALAWALASYGFDRYKKRDRVAPQLVWPKKADRDLVLRTAEAIHQGRDLINTPAGDLGPAELVAAAIGVAQAHGAEHAVIVGEGLLTRNYPTIHAVGRAASAAPRLFDMRWGDARKPKLTLVGKGVCFDSGGLDLKSAAGMKLMKKDMGGAASVLALARMIMGANLPVRLRVLIPAVENAVAGNAYRPGDIIKTRKGLTVEVGNTDAEGRLILCDALCEADREDPDLVIDFATLTGAARVALGTDVPAIFATDAELRARIVAAGERVHDPLWPLPLHAPYRKHLDSPIADLNNVGNVSEGGAITAALFLREFVARDRRWVHIDTMAYNAASRAGRPAGGEILGARAVFAALVERYGGR